MTARPFNSWDLAKIIGLLLMFVDHAGAYFFLDDQWLRAIGRGAAPIFLFLAGYASSYRFNREVFALACLMSLSNIVMGQYTNPLNILFSILLCRAVFAWLEKRGSAVEKPAEWWVACALFFLPTNFLFEYGTIGLAIAVSGYMKRRPQRYSAKTQRWFLIATFIVYAAGFALLFDLTPPNILLTALMLCFDYWLLSRLDIRPVNLGRLPAPLRSLLLFSARYSAYIYAIHLIVISWISGYPI